MKKALRKPAYLFLVLALLLFTLSYSCSIRNNLVQAALLTELKNPIEIYANQGRLYITDCSNEEQRCTSVLVYSLKDYRYLFKLGGDGEEPGKYTMQMGHSVYVGFPPDKLFINDYNKIGLYTSEGKYLYEKKTPGNSTIYHALDNRYVGRENIKEDGLSYYVVYLYDADLERMKEIYRVENPYDTETKKNRVFTRDLFYQSYKNHIYIKGKSEEFIIDVFDSSGTRTSTIHLPYTREEVTDHHKDEVYQNYKNHPFFGKYYDMIRAEIVFPEYLPVVFSFRVADERIYITTYKRKEDKTEIIILDLKGKILKKVFVPFSWQNPRYAILNGEMLQLIKNEDTNQWELKITRIL